MRSFALATAGRDKPGIVAAVTAALLEHRTNIEDAEMANLGGHFAIVLVLSAPDDVDEQALREDLDAVRTALPLEALALAPVEPLARHSTDVTHAITVSGADRPGIVHGVSEALAAGGVNIVGLSTRVVGDDPLYVMLLEVTLPPGLDEGDLEATLAATARELGVDVSARPVAPDVL